MDTRTAGQGLLLPRGEPGSWSASVAPEGKKAKIAEASRDTCPFAFMTIIKTLKLSKK